MAIYLLVSVATLSVAWPFALRARGNRTARMVVLLVLLTGGLVVAVALPPGFAGGLDVALGIVYFRAVLSPESIGLAAMSEAERAFSSELRSAMGKCLWSEPVEADEGVDHSSPADRAALVTHLVTMRPPTAAWSRVRDLAVVVAMGGWPSLSTSRQRTDAGSGRAALNYEWQRVANRKVIGYPRLPPRAAAAWDYDLDLQLLEVEFRRIVSAHTVATHDGATISAADGAAAREVLRRVSATYPPSADWEAVRDAFVGVYGAEVDLVSRQEVQTEIVRLHQEMSVTLRTAWARARGGDPADWKPAG